MEKATRPGGSTPAPAAATLRARRSLSPRNPSRLPTGLCSTSNSSKTTVATTRTITRTTTSAAGASVSPARPMWSRIRFRPASAKSSRFRVSNGRPHKSPPCSATGAPGWGAHAARGSLTAARRQRPRTSANRKRRLVRRRTTRRAAALNTPAACAPRTRTSKRGSKRSMTGLRRSGSNGPKARPP